MRFRASSTAKEDGTRPNIPGLRRRSPAEEETKETAIQENAKCDTNNADGIIGRKASKRKTVLDFFKGKGASTKPADSNSKLPTRSLTQKSGVSKTYSGKRNSDTTSANANEDLIDRIMGQPKQDPKQASENFFLKQRIRASSRQAASTRPSPYSARSQAEIDRKQLSEDEITSMFAGAPLFNVETKKSSLRPQVIFRGGDIEDLVIYGTDYQDFGHSSFAACSLGMHWTKDISGRPPSRQLEIQPSRDRAGKDLLEVPNMLSANGADRGTIGFEYFLQLPVADSMMLRDKPNQSNKRWLLTSDPETLGLRDFDIEELIDRLTSLGDLYSSLIDEVASTSLLNEDKISELGEDLFGKVLDANLGITPAGTGSVSLSTQIKALQNVLDIEDLWHNFGIVEWRIRVGQLLWASSNVEGSEADGGSESTERDVLLLQIALAAELLVRLKLMQALPASGSTFPPIISELDREAIKEARSIKVEWDLLLAEKFLENLSISARIPDIEKAGNRSSMFSAISYITAKEDPADTAVKPLLYPKNAEEQVAGLLSFAQALAWPHTADIKSQLEAKPDPSQKERPVSMLSIYATPLSSPTLDSSPGARSSYFGGWVMSQEQERRPGLSRKATAQSIQLLPASNIRPNSDGFEVGGWLSRSWLAGLVLPGEAASHFLIGTLLENSSQAIDTLGDCANLYGGFVYRGRTFWSKSCVVSRVLAVATGATECMGWISVPDAPPSQLDGWVNVSVKDFPYPPAQPRIKDAESVARDSDPLHGVTTTAVQAGDFTTPVDGPPVMGNEARSHGLSFSPSSPMPSLPELLDSLDDTSTSTAYLTFSSPINSKLAPLRVPLTYDVYFVSSYPCYPSSAPVRTRESSTVGKQYPSDSIWPSQSTLSFEKELPPPPAHALHIEYHFTVVPAATLLTVAPPESRSRALSSPSERPANAEGDNEGEVVILDCRGSADLELLARAWCAKVGEHALIGKEGRTCMSCCIREARALSIGVVIRI